MVKRLLQSGLIAALLFLSPIFAENLGENSRDFVNFSGNSVNLNANLGENSQKEPVIASLANARRSNPQPINNTIILAANSSENFVNSNANLSENSINSNPNSTQNSQTFILINEGILKPEAAARLDEIGTELKLKSGISLALGVSHQSLDELLNLAQSLNEPYLLFVMSLKDKKIKVQSAGVFAPNEAEKIAQKVLESSVYPLLGQKNPNYAAALFNGYADFADIIAANAKITLASSVGNANRQTMNIIKIVFYGVICVALLYFFSRRTKRKRV